MNTYWFMSLFKFSPLCPEGEWDIELRIKQTAVAVTEHGKPVNTSRWHTVGENYQPHSEIPGINSCQDGPCVSVTHDESITKLDYFPFSTQKSWLFLSYIQLLYVRENNNKIYIETDFF